MLSDTYDHFGDSDKGALGPGGGESVFADRAPITELPQPELGCAPPICYAQAGGAAAARNDR